MQDEEFMRAALAEARRGLGQTSPNPAVGAVIVRAGKIIARGYHHRAGLPHAEIEALRALPKPALARGATIYVTLEPCSTHGRTPPCVEAIIAAGFRRVVIGTIDPNPSHAGRGVKLLRDTGIAVTTDVLEAECRALNAAFNHWIVTKMPLVIAKAGMSLDGRITRPPGEGQWLTNAVARKDAHRLRSQVDAILIGAETLRQDNPRLTVRGVRGARQPWRIVITRSGKLPKEAHLFTDEHRERTLVYREKSLRTVLRDLGKRQITSVMIEGGGGVLGEAFDRRLVQRAHFYLAPLLCGGPAVVVKGLGVGSNAEAATIRNATYTRLGDNLCLTGEVEYPAPVPAA
ncbi:riboflavin biosynthesis protein RibD [Chthoniobacter flavus Ellin428]|uniref:Riboflavin biosynthesis protein RibD n=1 Tax=Chthoniobacter flavus Ellin428 TaxID=497964 RepID=B4D449_9BACT|nr:bifunctional diaminohydroxyphosphoribosylaminopyrimidine deaminase/5-amino-6-(5-phosphoribosylamino)uracil reductase RibD [Chthoniobacter flavus]EDY18650.1 riboflavin biosynthesis protein RibD [Chthoniobacter flavus Ellin428]TCO89111.1 diaminohydroxyphosphoribosylaminopyrimidine deaminase [Chthoniobacter flavus]